MKAALLRHTGRSDDALATVAAIRKIDPLDVQGMAEQWLAAESSANDAPLIETASEFPATVLEVAADYLNAGLWQDGSTLLTHIVDTAPDKSKVSPLVYYYLGYFAGQVHQDAKAREYDRLATKASPDYVFPFQMEMMAVLDDAMRINAADSRAPYYLGNLLFDWQPLQAQVLWEKSASLGADFPVVYRNLAMVYTRQGNQRDKAQAALEQAVQFGGNAMVFNDLDQLYEENGVSPTKRLALMESHQAVIDRDDVIAREINLEILAGKPDVAIQLLQSRFFRAWEGGGSFSLSDSWINANLERGHQHMAAKQYTQALADYHAALDIPANLDEALGDASERKPEISYWIGNAYQAMGDFEKAHQSWTEAATASLSAGQSGTAEAQYTGHFSNGSIGGLAAGVRVEQAALYYQALALEKLGQSDRAKVMFTQLVDTASKRIASSDMMTPIQSNAPAAQRARIADAYCLAGLGQLGLHNRDQARHDFSLALKASPDHYAATSALNAMTP